MYREGDTGTLAPGNKADIAVLDANVFAMPIDESVSQGLSHFGERRRCIRRLVYGGISLDICIRGALSILPPVLAIVLALLTKEVVSSLLIGILSGTIIYAVMAELNPVVAPIQIMFDMTIQTVDLYIILFCCLLGAWSTSSPWLVAPLLTATGPAAS